MANHSFLSITLECIILTILYRFLAFILLRRYLENRFKKQKWWSTLAEAEGYGESDEQVQRSVIYITILTVHHITGGLIMWFGYLFNQPEVFVHGMCIEVADDLHDSAVMILKEWPFYKDKSNARLMMFMIPHHLFGLLLTYPTILMGTYKNPNIMAGATALLLAGGVTLLVHLIQRTRDRNHPIQAWQDVFVGQINLWVFFFCRFYIWPIRTYRYLISDGGLSALTAPQRILMILAFSLMAFFNVAVGVDSLEKTQRGIKWAYSVGTPAKALGYTVRSLQIYVGRTLQDLEKLLVDMQRATTEKLKSF